MSCSCRHLFHKLATRGVKQLCLLLVPGMTALPLMAADIEDLQVVKHADSYHIKMVAVVDVPGEYVHKVLTDYKHLHRLNPSITESEVLPALDRLAVRVRTRIENCFFIFCMDIDRVEDIHESPSGDLKSAIVPELSDFRSGIADWRIQGMGERSRVEYMAHMEPDFHVPPLIGSIFFKAKLRKDITTGLMKLECLAKAEETLARNPGLQAAGIDVDTLCAEVCDPRVGQC